ncbi:MAG: thioredoxin domain-containing protein [Methanobacteriaceae archaeon]|nr:thioredoxin domain-containing protein [Methanobacteriaceae archaeon]MDO9626788.1 thioredoxin domain-containing protein [Methanobacteriaceae archaeon]
MSYPDRESKNKYQNRLIEEKSPYLQQHAYNPVDWHPWGEDAFNKAETENKPIFLSIGYSTCHWCHVMAHESFEDPEIGKLINEVFVPIKVDREERPEIDNIYMNVCQMMTGSGGWPLTIILTPEKKPFFAGTYFPRESQYGRIGLKELIKKIQVLWDENPQEAMKSADKVVAVLKQISENVPGALLSEEIFDETYQSLEESFDYDYGGFGMIQKFPSPTNIFFLLRHWKRTLNPNSLNMAIITLNNMYYGGIHDHIGFGFHRYTIDPQWVVPHFEKMLYDQALISMAYLEAFQATGNMLYQNIAKEVFEYVIRDMQSPQGGFYSAEDADSKGVEGKFYLWRKSEIDHLLGEDAPLICELFNISTFGNFEEESTGKQNGKNIIHLKNSLKDFANAKGLELDDLTKTVARCLEKLFNHRKNRIHPQKDDKILTDWNGLMIAALARGFNVIGNKKYLESAQKAADFILNNLYQNGKLIHRYKDGESAIDGNLDDYSFLIWGLMELYSATFEIKYLKYAFSLNETLVNHFLDGKSGGFFFTSDDAEEIILRKRESYDSAIPSGNSVQMMNLLKMAHISEDESLKEMALGIEHYFTEKIKRSPLAHTNMINAIDFRLGSSYNVVVVCNNKNQSMIMHEKLRADLSIRYIPNLTIMDITPTETKEENSKENGSLQLPFEVSESLKAKKSPENKCTFYVCSDKDCKPPLTEIKELLKVIEQ